MQSSTGGDDDDVELDTVNASGLHVDGGAGDDSLDVSATDTLMTHIAAGDGDDDDIRLDVVKHTEAKRGSVLLPRRWVVERTFGWLGRFRRLARDNERLTKTLEGWHLVATLALLLQNWFSSA